ERRRSERSDHVPSHLQRQLRQGRQSAGCERTVSALDAADGSRRGGASRLAPVLLVAPARRRTRVHLPARQEEIRTADFRSAPEIPSGLDRTTPRLLSPLGRGLDAERKGGLTMRVSKLSAACSSFVARWNGFWFGPQDPTLLGLMRILAGLVMLYTIVVHGLT